MLKASGLHFQDSAVPLSFELAAWAGPKLL
jgi:hypothetical protein